MEDDFHEENVTCCSVELYWTDKNKDKKDDDHYEYILIQKERAKGKGSLIYKGENTSFEAINLKPNREYIFKLNIMKKGEKIKILSINIKTLEAPSAVISTNSFKTSKKEKSEDLIKLSDEQKDTIKNCCALIFEENNKDIIIGNFDGIEMKLASQVENHIFLYYISFDVKSDYFEEFFTKYIEEWETNMITACHFIIQKLPTILIFHLLEKGPVIFTGKRMGGVIASSLAFYIMLIGKLKKNILYGNSFFKKEPNSIGVVTFGSPTFLTNLTYAFKMKEFTPYFYNIKEEFDFIPEYIDFINKEQKNYIQLIELFQKMEFLTEDDKQLHIYFNKNNYTDENLKKTIERNMKLPFGCYISFNAMYNSLVSIKESKFDEFYYFKQFQVSNPTSNLKLYETLKSDIKFNKDDLEFLVDKNHKLEFIKIIRREINPESMKGIIKFTLTTNEPDNISSDIIQKITLISNKNTYEISNKDIYYDNDIDITAHLNNLKEDIKDAKITTYFGGEIKSKNIINIKGSNSTREMLKDNIEKLFLFPFFKLIEIFYASSNDDEKYEELKKQNFGNRFENLNILKAFEKQIKAINELLFLSRPDILGKFEKKFIDDYTENKLTEKQMNSLEDCLTRFYKYAIQLQIKQKIKCLDLSKDSIAGKIPFPAKIKDSRGLKKLFMCESKYLECENIISEEFDNFFIKDFFLEKLIKETLDSEEAFIKGNLKGKNREECKKYLNSNIGNIYNELIIPNVYFIKILILSSIESGDLIKFKHDIDTSKISLILLYPLIWLKPFGEKRAQYEKDFMKNYSGYEKEELNMINLFNKITIKNIFDSEISANDNKDQNKTFEFSEYSQNQICGKEYYSKFLELFKNYANDFEQDIEISIYDNLKPENKYKDKNYKIIKEMVNELIDDNESKKGFLALVRQSYLLGKLRSNIVSIIIYNFIHRKKNLLLVYLVKKRQENQRLLQKYLRIV